MMGNCGAEIGDEVVVCWKDGSEMTGTVEHIACAEGDSWIIHSRDGDIYHVQQFELIRVTSRKAPKEKKQ